MRGELTYKLGTFQYELLMNPYVYYLTLNVPKNVLPGRTGIEQSKSAPDMKRFCKKSLSGNSVSIYLAVF